MEEWVPASRLAPLNKKSLKRLRDVDVTYADKAGVGSDADVQKTAVDAASLEKDQTDVTKASVDGRGDD